MSKRANIILFSLCAVGALLLAISIGGARISLREIIAVFAYRIFRVPLPDGFSRIVPGVIWYIRLPRVMMGFLVGAALAVSGTVMQSVLKNPLASSYTIGVSAGAGLGAVIIIVTGVSSGLLGMFLMPAAAITAGMGTVFLAVWLASRVDRGLDNFAIVLMGMVLSIFMNAIMMTLAARNSQHAQQIVAWQLGSFSGANWTEVAIVAAVSIVMVVALVRFAREMDVLTFGDEQAGAIGVEVRRVKLALILLSSVLTGVAVAFVGIIAFVDLIAPHVARKFVGASHRYVVPVAALFGGTFMVLADLVSRTFAAPAGVPVGSVTALVGAPFFAYIFLRSRKGAS